MGVVFHVRGDQLDARYAPGGNKAGAWGGANKPILSTDQPGINGSTSIDFATGGLQQRSLHYFGRGNVPKTGVIQVVMRVYFNDLGNQPLGLFKIGFGGRFPRFGYGAYVTGSNQVRWYQWDESGTQDATFASPDLLVTGQWYDLCFGYPAGPTVGGSVIQVDNTIDRAQNSALTMPAATMAELEPAMSLQLGYYSDSGEYTDFYVDEFWMADNYTDTGWLPADGGGTVALSGSRNKYLASTPDSGSLFQSGGGSNNKGILNQFG